jgi:hypothetical protein
MFVVLCATSNHDHYLQEMQSKIVSLLSFYCCILLIVCENVMEPGIPFFAQPWKHFLSLLLQQKNVWQSLYLSLSSLLYCHALGDLNVTEDLSRSSKKPVSNFFSKSLSTRKWKSHAARLGCLFRGKK